MYGAIWNGRKEEEEGQEESGTECVRRHFVKLLVTKIGEMRDKIADWSRQQTEICYFSLLNLHSLSSFLSIFTHSSKPGHHVPLSIFSFLVLILHSMQEDSSFSPLKEFLPSFFHRLRAKIGVRREAMLDTESQVVTDTNKDRIGKEWREWQKKRKSERTVERITHLLSFSWSSFSWTFSSRLLLPLFLIFFFSPLVILFHFVILSMFVHPEEEVRLPLSSSSSNRDIEKREGKDDENELLLS